MKVKVFSKSDVKKLVIMEQAIAGVREAYIQLSSKNAQMPLRTSISVKKNMGIALYMPAYLPEIDALGIKIVTVFPENIKKGLPALQAVIVVTETDTGRPAALMDGTYLTALRTGAASGVATELLSRNDSSVAAIIGAGIQGRTQLEAVCTVRPIKKVWVYDSVQTAAKTYTEEMSVYGSPIPSDIVVASSPAQAVKDADVICTATPSTSPVFEDKDLKPGVHINAVGAYTEEMQEIPPETVARARVSVDSISACLEEAGDLIKPLKKGLISETHIAGEIGDIASGKIPGRESNDEVTFFKSVGLAIQDVAVAELVLQNGKKKGIGKEVEL
ncbi:MAG: hypothetical protein JSV25_01025 [Spirochaetota bacterium]|nr:MAG: hypothetical protein JSV25_01025 [Spirochaetota bacterium]